MFAKVFKQLSQNCNPQAESRQPKIHDRRLRDHGRCVLFLFMLLVSVVGCFAESVEELCVNYMENCAKFVQQVMKIVSWSGLGEVLGALGMPLGIDSGLCSVFAVVLRIFGQLGIMDDVLCFFSYCCLPLLIVS